MAPRTSQGRSLGSGGGGRGTASPLCSCPPGGLAQCLVPESSCSTRAPLCAVEVSSECPQHRPCLCRVSAPRSDAHQRRTGRGPTRHFPVCDYRDRSSQVGFSHWPVFKCENTCAQPGFLGWGSGCFEQGRARAGFSVWGGGGLLVWVRWSAASDAATRALPWRIRDEV